MCMDAYIPNYMNYKLDKDLVPSGNNGSNRSVWASYRSDVIIISRPPTSVSIHSPTSYSWLVYTIKQLKMM